MIASTSTLNATVSTAASSDMLIEVLSVGMFFLLTDNDHGRECLFGGRSGYVFTFPQLPIKAQFDGFR